MHAAEKNGGFLRGGGSGSLYWDEDASELFPKGVRYEREVLMAMIVFQKVINLRQIYCYQLN